MPRARGEGERGDGRLTVGKPCWGSDDELITLIRMRETTGRTLLLRSPSHTRQGVEEGLRKWIYSLSQRSFFTDILTTGFLCLTPNERQAALSRKGSQDPEPTPLARPPPSCQRLERTPLTNLRGRGEGWSGPNEQVDAFNLASDLMKAFEHLKF
ncbi:hypothetical protein IE53DRAFT_152082 [Violaceomyces palustris]|uniref:Uncharacterized protein n=1 Tax=Violaceomyces palustris TaxID=1673888 RepID=A0ACD0NU55_9BASI|nr:hypothetical protein IE53DRAFT_152082 [Violaceomyces palustris]